MDRVVDGAVGKKQSVGGVKRENADYGASSVKRADGAIGEKHGGGGGAGDGDGDGGDR